MADYDLIIVGGGMVGVALALSIKQSENLKIAIVEPRDEVIKLGDDFSLRVSAITLKSQHFLQDIGVWDLIERKSNFDKTRVWDENSYGKLDFADDGQNLGHIIENDALKLALSTRLKSTGISQIHAKLEGLEKIQNGYKINTNTGDFSCNLLVGADGANSLVRDFGGFEYSEKDYYQSAIICNIESEASLENTTWQRFLSDSIIALLPLADKIAAIVWSLPNQTASELQKLPKNEVAKRLSEASGYRFGKFKLLSEIQAFPLIDRHANTYVKPNLALIGDAAHSIHPLAGQGVNLGFKDAKSLSSLIQKSTIGNYQILQKYSQSRRYDNELMAKTMTTLNWIFKQNNEPFRWLRAFGMNTINQIPPLKTYLQSR